MDITCLQRLEKMTTSLTIANILAWALPALLALLAIEAWRKKLVTVEIASFLVAALAALPFVALKTLDIARYGTAELSVTHWLLLIITLWPLSWIPCGIPGLFLGRLAVKLAIKNRLKVLGCLHPSHQPDLPAQLTAQSGLDETSDKVRLHSRNTLRWLCAISVLCWLAWLYLACQPPCGRRSMSPKASISR
jgi:hypothetical protein